MHKGPKVKSGRDTRGRYETNTAVFRILMQASGSAITARWGQLYIRRLEQYRPIVFATDDYYAAHGLHDGVVSWVLATSEDFSAFNIQFGVQYLKFLIANSGHLMFISNLLRPLTVESTSYRPTAMCESRSETLWPPVLIFWWKFVTRVICNGWAWSKVLSETDGNNNIYRQ